MNYTTARILILFHLVIVSTIVITAGCSTSSPVSNTEITAEQVDKNISKLTEKVTKPSVRAALTEFQSKATLQEKRDFLAGTKSLDVPASAGASTQGGPGCHCTVTVHCKPGPSDINQCEVGEPVCTGPGCE